MTELRTFKTVNFTNAAIDILADRIDQKKDSAFYICNLGDIITKYKKWQKILPNVDCFYSVQCNHDIAVLKLLKQLGSSFDCSSKQEIETVLSIGVEPTKILYMHPHKRISYLEYAKSVGINFLVFDTVEELHKINKVYQTSARLMMRLNVSNVDFLLPSREKFGVHRHDVDELLKVAKELEMNVVGVSFQFGNECKTIETFYRIIKFCSQVVESGRKLGFKISTLDIGGSGIDSEVGKFLSIENVGGAIQRALKESFGDEAKSLKLIAEPCQFMVSSAFCLVTAVQGKKLVKYGTCEDCDEEVVKRCCYYINESCHGSFGRLCKEFDLDIKQPTVLRSALNLEKDSGRDYVTAIYGETMDWLDCMYENETFQEIFVGDHLLWENWGAYWKATASEYNGFKTTDVYYIISEEQRKELMALTRLEDIGLVDIKK